MTQLSLSYQNRYTSEEKQNVMKRGLSKILSPIGSTPLFTFVDLFAGIGGLRLGFEPYGGRCVFTCEWDLAAQDTYRRNFTDEHQIQGDITSIDESTIPNHDLLLAGFPCQPFSLAGISKKNALGRPHGFACEAQGTLFFELARIIKAKRPKAFLLENVKNLISHEKGKTFGIIRKILEHDLGYHIQYRILDGRHFVPQHRERVFIVGFREETGFDWDSLPLPEANSRLKNILHQTNETTHPDEERYVGANGVVHTKYTLSDPLWQYLKDYAEKHRQKGNGFGYSLATHESVTRTLSARYYKDGSEILLAQEEGRNPRKLTPRECARLMGYPDSFVLHKSDTQAYKQLGNSVVVPLVSHVAHLVLPWLILSKDKLEAKTKSISIKSKRKTQ